MRLFLLLTVAALLGGTSPACAAPLRSAGRPGAAEFGGGTTAAPYVTTAAAAYCHATGGAVQVRIPEFGTNGTTPLVLAGSAPFCTYTAKDGSQISLFLSTLYTRRPTLAALAYYAKVPESKTCQSSGGANPASCYCTQLGGSDQFGGANLGGGAWVLPGSSNPDLEACIFPDLSSIDSFGLFYHSAGIVRGKALAGVLRYHKPKG